MKVFTKKHDLVIKTCNHGHTESSHPNCFLVNGQPRWYREASKCYFDIEASGLALDIGIMYSWCLKPRDGKMVKRVITQKELMDSNIQDKEVARELINELCKYDILVTHYGQRYDIPAIRTVALYWNLDFPVYGTIYNVDTWNIAKSKLRIHSNRLESIMMHLGYTGKTSLEPRVWRRAASGDKAALSRILYHNEKDVVVLEQIHKRLEKFSRVNKTSI